MLMPNLLNVLVFGSQAFGKEVDLGEVMRVGPFDEINALIRRET
jgi:hypothetical protein